MLNIAVTGASSGLGKSICDTLGGADFDGEIEEVFPIRYEDFGDLHRTEAQELLARDAPEKIDILINCAGSNRLDWFENLEPTDFYDLFDDNVMTIVRTTQTLLERLKSTKGTIINIVSNASHMPMTHSAAYNASKGAAHILTLQMAHELTKRFGISVFGISPNKLKGTGMSTEIETRVCELRGWTPEEAEEYQLNSLLSGQETDPEQLAEFIAYLVADKSRHQHLTGTVIPYGK